MVRQRNLQPVWEDEYTVHSFLIDTQSRLSFTSICRLIQESAWHHAEHLGLGYGQLIRQNLAWVLSRQYVEIQEYPRWGDRIKIVTWPTYRDRVFCFRDFQILDASDSMLGFATTAWIAFNVKSRKPQPTESYVRDILPENPNRVTTYPLKKLSPTISTEPVRSFAATYSDLDVNGHVNNVSFIAYVLDCFSLKFHQRYQIASAEINFLAEGRVEDCLNIYTECVNKLTHHHCIRRQADGTDLCRSKITFKAE